MDSDKALLIKNSVLLVTKRTVFCPHPQLPLRTADEDKVDVPRRYDVPQLLFRVEFLDRRTQEALGEADNVLAGAVALIGEHVVAFQAGNADYSVNGTSIIFDHVVSTVIYK